MSLTLTEKAILAEARRIRKERATARRMELEQKLRKQLAARPTPETSPDVDLRCCGVVELLGDLTGAGLVHADPPWEYRNQRINGAATNHYGDASIAAIAQALDAAYDCAAEDCYLLLWATFPLLREWLEGSRGLRWNYKSGGVWAKQGGLGVGFHWRGDAELLLLYTKGNPRPRTTLSNTFLSQRSRHSEKPTAWLRALVEAFSAPGCLVLDLYAGLAPMARACQATGRRYVGAEIDALRHHQALEALVGPNELDTDRGAAMPSAMEWEGTP